MKLTPDDRELIVTIIMVFIAIAIGIWRAPELIAEREARASAEYQVYYSPEPQPDVEGDDAAPIHYQLIGQ